MKTRKEAEKEFWYWEGLRTTGEIEELHLAFDMGIEFAQRWIPIEEELPELFEQCLCSNEWSIFVGHYDGDYWICDNNGDITIVNKWRPIEYK